jgi:hypothetical protein
MRTSLALAAVVTGLALPVLPLTAAQGIGAPGAGFASLTVTAVGHGQEFLFSSTTQIPGQLTVPYALSSLKYGEGSATATVAWPGATAASLGTTAVLLGAPSQLQALDDPAIATARSGSGDADVNNTTVPGAVMHATATATKATALASVQGSDVAATTAGETETSSSVTLTGERSAVATAAGLARDVTLAGGTIHIASVVSTATGHTDGVSADATGQTAVSGLTVAGVPVTVDDKGVRAAGTTVLPPGATDPVTSALAQAQVQISLTSPVKKRTGGEVEYSTGALVIATPLGTVTLGGAEVVLAATPADAAGAPQPQLSTPEPGDPLAAVTPGLPGGEAFVPGAAGAGAPASASAPAVASEVSPPPANVTAALIALRAGYGWAWLVSGSLLAFAAASGLAGLSRRWLAPDLRGCPLERSA